MLSTFLVLALGQAATAAGDGATVDGPVMLTSAQIREYNSTLNRGDPAYIRCVREIATGSLVRKQTTCRTNAEWRRVQDIGNQDAHDLVEGFQARGFTNQREPGVVPLNGGGG